MKVTEVSYVKRFNDGNYEHTEIGLTAQVDGSKENVSECVSSLKDIVYSSRGEAEVKASEPEVAEEEEVADEEVEVKEEKPKRGRKAKVEEPEEPEEEEVEEAEEEPEEEEEKPKAKKFRSKAATYDRTNEVHREIFADLIKGIDPKWNATDVKKARAKKVSQLMNGEEFLDAEGEVLASFTKETKKALLGK
jgi:hypothetical protein